MPPKIVKRGMDCRALAIGERYVAAAQLEISVLQTNYWQLDRYQGFDTSQFNQVPQIIILSVFLIRPHAPGVRIRHTENGTRHDRHAWKTMRATRRSIAFAAKAGSATRYRIHWRGGFELLARLRNSASSIRSNSLTTFRTPVTPAATSAARRLSRSVTRPIR